MRFEFRPQLPKAVKSYAEHTPHVTEETLDCSMGVNPYGCPKQAVDALKSFDTSLLSSYPHSNELAEALISYWEPYASFGPEHLTMCNGSVCGIYSINSIFAQAPRTEVVGFVPSFTDAIENMKSLGMNYKGIPIRLDEGGLESADDLIAALTENTAMVYIDRPHNPTGQTMPLADVEKVAKAALENGSYLFMDEAYADFIPCEESSLCLRNKYPNIIVLRTFSKGFGLANLRGGYIVANAEFTGYLHRTLNPYILSDLERRVCAAALSAGHHGTAHAADFAAVKQQLRAVTGTNIKMLCTDDRVPICTLMLQRRADLQELLLRFNVLAVSGVEFELLDERYVRVRVPLAQDVPRLVEAVRASETAE